MRNQKWKHPNALKHGVYASMAIVPGEDPQQFKELHSALVEEWEPAGATEQDAVLTIAKAVWRKRRSQEFIQVQLFKSSVDPKHPLFDEALGLARLAVVMTLEPETAFQKHASASLRADKINYLNQKFPRSDFKSTEEWARAIVSQICAWRAESNFDADRILALLRSSVAISNDLFKQELELDAHLDAQIDRAFKRLIQIKTMKQMLGQTSTGQSDDRPGKLVGMGTSKK
jgi:hypothetical protein